ncbi:MAG: hypothetical protein WCJ25_01050 [Candidatus Moraniibacteriota bacterium]
MNYRSGLVVAVSLLFVLIPLSKASAEDVFVFHFERNGEKIMFDTSVPKSVSKIDDPAFSFSEFSHAIHVGPYSLDMFDVSGAKAVSTHFDIPQGKNSFEVPYFSIVNRFQLTLVRTGEVLLEGSLADFVTCNANGICEYEKGENINTCLSDCASGNVKYSPQTQALLDKNNGIIKDPSGTPILYKSGAIPAVNPLPLPSSDNTVSHPASMPPAAAQQQSYPIWVVVATVAGFFLVLGIAFVLWRRNHRE